MRHIQAILVSCQLALLLCHCKCKCRKVTLFSETFRPQLDYTGLLAYRITFRIGQWFHLHYHAVIRYSMSEQNHSALEVIRKVIRYVPCRKLSCVNGDNPIRSAIVVPNQNNMAAFKFNYMMKMLVYTVASLMQMNSFLFHITILAIVWQKLQNIVYSPVPSVGISGAEQCNCQYFRVGLG